MNEHIEIIYGNFFEKRVSEKLEREKERGDRLVKTPKSKSAVL